jgi:S-adenosylmethionine:tRNA ribosyltransferase-isomerase
MTAALAFELPASLEATAPPEARGLERDEVKLLVATAGGLTHARFRDLPDYLQAGDVLVVNDSATLPAAVPATLPDGTRVRVHYATAAPGLPERWAVVEIRDGDAGRLRKLPATGTSLTLRGGAGVAIEAPYARGDRLLLARMDGSWVDYLQAHGEPIRYGYAQPRPLSDYQTVYAREPGSAEMASAGRPFTERLLDTLADRGITVATITLHAGVSSPERHEPPIPERYSVPAATAAAVTGAGRVIAVGTTVVGRSRARPATAGRTS